MTQPLPSPGVRDFDRLLTLTDGGVSECISMMIGQYIHVDPEHFLKLLSRYSHFSALGKTYCNFGINLVDDFEGQEREARRRIKAIETSMLWISAP